MPTTSHHHFSDPAKARAAGHRGRARIRTRKILELLHTGPMFDDDRVAIIEAATNAPEIEAFLAGARDASREAGK